jgi:signal transduction histidine kinase
MIDSAEVLETVDQQAALAAYRQSAAFSRATGYLTGEARSLHYSGLVYSQMGRYDSSLRCFSAAAPLYEKARNYWGVGACYNSAANVYQYMTMYDSALANYQRALDLFTLHQMEAHKKNLYIGKGRVLQAMKAHQLALQDYIKAEELALSLKDSAVLAQALINQGTVYFDLQQPHENFTRQMRALNIGRLIHSHYIEQVAGVNLADHYNRRQQYDSAMWYARLALDKAALLQNRFDVVKIKCIVAGIHSATGEHATALRLLEEGRRGALEISSEECLAEVYNKMQQVYERSGDFANAYRYLQLYNAASDSILSSRHIKTLHEMEVRHQTAQKDAALTKGKLDIQLKNNLIMLVSVISGAIILLLALVLVRSRFRHRLQQEKVRTLEKVNEIRLLEAAMNGEERERVRIASDLHDGVAGMLAAVKMHLSQLQQTKPSYFNNQGFDNALQLLDDASQEVRKTAHNLMPEMILQFGLDESLRKYCNNVSKDGRTAVAYHSLGDIPRCMHSFELAVYRITQELVHNAIRHSGAPEIMVQLSQVDMLLSVTVEDNGKGFDTAADGGMGFLALKNRVRAIRGTIEWSSSPGNGASVYAEFDISRVVLKK